MSQSRTKQRCINIDWLEVYALEPVQQSPRNADFYRNAGLSVKQREYGTPIYHEMFTIMDEHNLPLIEVRRNPKSAAGVQANGVLDPRSSHIRLSNRTCYFDNAATILQTFLQTYGYELIRISRLDLALDFEYFDYGDEPQKFLNRYINGKYAKINQSNISLHGLDCWDGRYWNSVRWGSKTSMVATRFYDKTMELQQQHDKPYIRQAWFQSGLVDDWFTLERVNEQGQRYKPRIWRVEFEIKSSDKNWFRVENFFTRQPKFISIRHTLAMYETRQQMLDVFFSICNHYFHFKKIEYINGKDDGADRQLQRKDRCPDKRLFDTSTISTYYKLKNVATSAQKSVEDERLLKYLYKFQQTTIEPAIHKAIYTIIEHLEKRVRRDDFITEIDDRTLKLMRLLIQRRMYDKTRSYDETKKIIENYMETEMDLFV